MDAWCSGATGESSELRIIDNPRARGHLAGGSSAGSGVAPWDVARLPVTDGGRYTLSAGGKAFGTVETALLPSQPADAESAAAALIARGCTAQLDLLATTMGQP